MLKAGPHVVIEAAMGIVKEGPSISHTRSKAVDTSTATFLEWAQVNREKLDAFAQSTVPRTY